MKKTVLALATAAVIACASPARAELPVIDVATLAQWQEYMPIAADQLQTMVNSYNTLANVFNTAERIDESVMRVYAQATAIYRTLQRLTDPNSYAQRLHAMHNSMPFGSGVAPGYFSGTMSPVGVPFGDAYMALNAIGQIPNDISFVGWELKRTIQSISTLQAVATGNLQSLEERALLLPDIQRQLDSADTLKATADINARLVAEQNYVSLQQAQAQNLLVSAQMQREATDQRQRQALYQHNLAQVSAACAAASSGGMPAVVPACTTSAGATPPTESYVAVAQ